MTTKRSRVVILGGGFAGLVTAHNLARHKFAKRRAEVTVIDVTTAHLYTPWLYEVATAGLSKLDEATRDIVENSVNLEYTKLADFKGIRFVHEKIVGLNTKTRHVILAEDRHVPYDILLVSLGAEPNYFGIPGLPDHALTLKTFDDAHRIRNAAARLIKGATRYDPKHIVVCGGGPNGIEFMSELANTVRVLERKGTIPRGAVHITLIDASAETNSILPEPLRSKANAHLKRLGITLAPKLRVTEVGPGFVKAFTESGKEHDAIRFPSDLTIWSGGVKVRELIAKLPFAKDPKGRILVEDTFHVPDFPGVFAAGDCAAQKNPFTNRPDPQSAQVAHYQAHYVAKNIRHLMAGKPLKPMKFPKRWHFMCAMGGKVAAGVLFGVRIWGYHGYLLRRLIDLRYFVTLLPLIPAIRLWLRAMRVFGLNDK